MNVLELKAAYLKYMGEHSPIWANRKPTSLVDFPSGDCFAVDGHTNWFTRRLTRDPWSSEAFSHCARCLSSQTSGNRFFLKLEGLGWNMFNRRKAIKDNVGFLREIGLDTARLKVSVWKGGKFTGKGVNAAGAGIEPEGSSWEGIEIPADRESIDAWEESGLAGGQIVELGEGERLDDASSGVIHLRSAVPFAGIRTGICYSVKDRYVEIGESIVDLFVKKKVASRMHVASAALENADSGEFLVRLKAKTITGGFGAERLAMVLNRNETIFELEPYRDMESFLVAQGRAADRDRDRVRKAIANIPAIVWLVNDGANRTEGSTKPRQAIFCDILQTLIDNMRELDLESDSAYLTLFRHACDFYARDDDFRSVAGLEAACLVEIKKQQRRMKAAT